MAKKAGAKKKSAKVAARRPTRPVAKSATQTGQRAGHSTQYAARTDLNAPVAAALDAMPEPQRAIAWALDAMIHKAAGKHEVVSQVKWGNACYCVGGADLFGIAAHKAHVSLYVGNGASLDERCAQVLEGTGKLMRHVKCRTLDEAMRKDVRQVIDAAVALALTDKKTAWTRK